MFGNMGCGDGEAGWVNEDAGNSHVVRCWAAKQVVAGTGDDGAWSGLIRSKLGNLWGHGNRARAK